MSAINFKDLKAHVGHKIECATYGEKNKKGKIIEVWNVAIECMDCYEILMSYDHPDVMQQ